MIMDNAKYRVWYGTENITEGDAFKKGNLRIYLLPDGSLEGFSREGVEWVPVDCSNLDYEQCSGLSDITGRLIYEGDIICIYGYYAVVIKEEGSFFTMNNYVYSSLNRSVDECEVVGNIHQNPDLMNLVKE